jgi:hypothetical protein
MRLTTFGILFVALVVVTASSLPASAIRAAQAPRGDATITGRVVDQGSQAPIAGARVMLMPAAAGRRLAAPMGIPAQAVTGDDGVYTLNGVTAGRYRLQVQKPGFVSTNPGETALVQVNAGQAVAGPVVQMSRGSAISGRVIDARGEPIAELMVTAVRKTLPASGRGRGNPPPLPAGQPGQTNDIGEYRISGLPAGDYYVSASPSPRPVGPFGQPSSSGATTPITTFYPGSPEIAGAQVISVAAGQTISGLEFTMLTARAFTVSGVVVDEMNRPVGGAMVMMMPAQLAAPGPGLRASGRSAPDGTFTIGGVASGAYRLNASVPTTVSSGGPVSGGVRGGITWGSGGVVSYSSASGPAAMIPVTVADADVTGVTVVVRQPVQ